MAKKHFLITITGPSGIGKGYLKKYLKDYFNAGEFPVCTTRKKRKDDESKERIFLTEKEFKEKLKNGRLVFSGEFCNYLYGFDCECFKNLEKKRIVTEVLIDNVEEFREKYPQAIMLTLLTDSISFLRCRLKKRGENDEELKKRLQAAGYEMKESERLRNKFNLLYYVNRENEDRIVDEMIRYINQELKYQNVK